MMGEVRHHHDHHHLPRWRPTRTLVLQAVVWCGVVVWKSRASSQGQQDGIVGAVLEVIGETNKWFVEIGFNAASFEGGSGSNSFALYRRGWQGLLLDAEFSNASINLHRAFVTAGNAAELLRRHGVPVEPDYVSLDIDSADVWVLRSLLSTFKPRVVSVEYNSNFGDGKESALAFPDPSWMPDARVAQWSGTCFYGSSANALKRVADEFGYVVAGVVHGLDLILVPAKLWPWAPVPFEAFSSRLDTWPAMTPADAALLLDYDVFRSGGSLCDARRHAALTLRRLARGGSKCDCFLKDVDCRAWTRNCSCFDLLADLPVPECVGPARPTHVWGTDVQSLDILGARWHARVDLPQAYVRHRLDAASFLTDADGDGTMAYQPPPS